MPQIAVLTGDLIDSTRVAAPKALNQRLQVLLDELVQRCQAEVTTFRGDGFQVRLPRPRQALECALYLRAGLLAASPAPGQRWDTRVSIALGDDKSATDIYGQAFVESGRGLDAMKKERLRFYAEPVLLRMAVELATVFVDDIINHWTPTEAEAYFEHRRTPGSHQQIADRLRKRRATVTQALLRARYTLLDQYLEQYDRLLEMTHAR